MSYGFVIMNIIVGIKLANADVRRPTRYRDEYGNQSWNSSRWEMEIDGCKDSSYILTIQNPEIGFVMQIPFCCGA